MHPPIAIPPEFAHDGDDRDGALRDLLRSRLGALGPVTAAALAAPLELPVAEVESALFALQTEGFVLQGHFSDEGGTSPEWCERHLLARIHRYTLGKLRREIEPVEPRDFARFLFEWQHVAAASRVSGPEALAGILAQLEGYEAPAGSWEAELLSARMTDYSAGWLDELCTSGRTLWTRLRPRAAETRGGGGSLRATPILLLPRRAAPLWRELAPAPEPDDRLGSRARRVVEFLSDHGASFFDDMLGGLHLLRAELEDALSELVVRGRVHCDSYAGLRALLVPPSRRASKATSRRGRVAWFGIQDAGRWSLVRPRLALPADQGNVASPSPATAAEAASLEHVARILLRRYGVVCWRLMEREPSWLPPWRELARVYRRLEARGEIRGGRFIAGLSGEQYALPEAIAQLRQVRRRPAEGALVSIAAADPANLLGSVMPGKRLARVAGARVLWRDGVPIATSVGGEVEWLADDVAAAERPALRRRLEAPQPLATSWPASSSSAFTSAE